MSGNKKEVLLGRDPPGSRRPVWNQVFMVRPGEPVPEGRPHFTGVEPRDAHD